VIAVPEIRSFRIEDGSDCDFIVLGSNYFPLLNFRWRNFWQTF